MTFTVDYVVRDDFGILKVLCMVCGKQIKGRVDQPTKDNGRQVVVELAKFPEYREIPVITQSGKIAFLMVCSDHQFVDIGTDEAARVTTQIENAYRAQLVWEGKPDDVITALMDEISANAIERKADVREVVKAMKGAR